MKKITILFLLAVLTGCVSNVELQNKDNLTGSDQLKPSPCAGCDPIPYGAPTFEWVEINHG